MPTPCTAPKVYRNVTSEFVGGEDEAPHFHVKIRVPGDTKRKTTETRFVFNTERSLIFKT